MQDEISFLVTTVNEQELRVREILAKQAEEKRLQEEEMRRHTGEEAMKAYRDKRMQEGPAEIVTPGKKKKNKRAEPPPVSAPEGPPLPVPASPAVPEESTVSIEKGGLNSSLLNEAEDKAAAKSKKCLCC